VQAQARPRTKLQIEVGYHAIPLICERCHAGQMAEYQRQLGKGATITGKRCDRCGYTELDSDDDVWSAVGL
jgi:hypothetical protein